MVEIDWQTFKVRCHAIVKVMSNSSDNPVLTDRQVDLLAEYRKKLEAGKKLTDKQKDEFIFLEGKEENGKKTILSLECIKYLMVEYAYIREGMIPVSREAMDIMPIKKGNLAERDGIKLLIRADKLPYKEHLDEFGRKIRIRNDYLSGEIDAYEGEEVMKARIIADIKNTVDYPTFLTKLHTGLATGQREQVQGYMDISGAKIGYIVNTLCTFPHEMIEDMRWSLARKLGCATTESPEFIEEWPKWEHSMKYDHMEAALRVNKIKIDPFTDVYRQKLYERVKVCREWIYEFDEQRKKLKQ